MLPNFHSLFPPLLFLILERTPPRVFCLGLKKKTKPSVHMPYVGLGFLNFKHLLFFFLFFKSKSFKTFGRMGFKKTISLSTTQTHTLSVFFSSFLFHYKGYICPKYWPKLAAQVESFCFSFLFAINLAIALHCNTVHRFPKQ